ncbi:MAG: type IX secretion system membrane protein PorP/SprF [Carboxylicivirga sp.]|jgi:type IX secretion system PorP/SprF family membrane protein|nr:type IX secretion system membrane protein PorP/SprF [Carboxylicivirga sp.]
MFTLLNNINHRVLSLRVSLLVLILLTNANVQAQVDLLSTQYMNNQLLINPAYAGVRNSFSANLFSRQQWMGIKDAPTTYALSIHSPLNKRMASLGSSLVSYKSGPVQQNDFSAVYSYLIRLNHSLFVSMGISAQVNHFNIGLNTLELIEDNDLAFATNYDNGIKPNFGVGAFLYSPQFYFGVSMPKALSSELKNEDGNNVLLEQSQSLFVTSGYAINVNKSLVVKPSFLGQMRFNENYLFDVNLQLLFKELFWIGGSYRSNSTMSALLNVRAGKSLAVCYSYDFSTGGKNSIGVGSHEVSLIFDSQRFIKRNRDRRFNPKKKKTKEADKALESIRYF